MPYIDNSFYGKIDFYSMKGVVMETLYYDNKDEFDREIQESYEIWRPIKPEVLSGYKYLDSDYEEELEW